MCQSDLTPIFSILPVYSRRYLVLILNRKVWFHYVMDGSSFTMANETPLVLASCSESLQSCADPYAGCCRDRGLKTLGYLISIDGQMLNSFSEPSLYKIFVATSIALAEKAHS